MKKPNGNSAPRARQESLVVQEMDDEVLVYDLERHKAHCLNKAAALVWRRCDGKSTVSEITRRLQNESEGLFTEDVVWLAVSRLEKVHLLKERIIRPVGRAGVSRRDLLKKVGWAAAVSLPLITSIISPTAAQGQSASLPAGACENRKGRDCKSDTDACGGESCITIVGNCVGKCRCHGTGTCHCDALGAC